MTLRLPAAAASVAIVLGAVRAAGAQGAAADTSSVAAARRLLDAAERELTIRSVKVNRAGWIGENFITHDTEVLAAEAQAEVALAIKRLVDEARPFDRAALPADVRRGWHTIGVPMRDRYARFVALANEGARAMGFADAGAMWRAGYDMPPDSFVVVVDKLWQEVRPLYVQLHAFVRRRLVARYGPKLVPPGGMLSVQLLGDMWGQDWSNIADVVIPPGASGSGVDLTAILKARKVAPLDMVRTGERFYVSLGFDSLPATF